MPKQNLWDFAVAIYGADGVSQACLELQDASGVDVPVLLFGAWLAQQGMVLTEEDVVRVDARVHAWRDEVIEPLRRIRRRLKHGPPPAPSVETDALRERVKAAELGAERIELALLEVLAAELLLSMAVEPADASATILERLVRHFRSRPPDDATNRAVEVILRALARDGGDR